MTAAGILNTSPYITRPSTIPLVPYPTSTLVESQPPYHLDHLIILPPYHFTYLPHVRSLLSLPFPSLPLPYAYSSSFPVSGFSFFLSFPFLSFLYSTLHKGLPHRKSIILPISTLSLSLFFRFAACTPRTSLFAIYGELGLWEQSF